MDATQILFEQIVEAPRLLARQGWAGSRDRRAETLTTAAQSKELHHG